MSVYDREYLFAQMANGSYDNKPRKISGWTVQEADIKIDKQTGFAACAYTNDKTGEVVIAYRGTDETSPTKDMAANTAISGVTNWHQQFAQGLQFAEKIRASHPNAVISVTGHSLGGAIAQVTSQMYGFKGVTFDPGGAENLIKSTEFKNWTHNGVHVTPKGAPNDFVSYLVNDSAVSHKSGTHVGGVHPVSGKEGRGDTEYALTNATKYVGIGATAAAAYVYDQKQRHSMDRIEETFKHAVRDGHLNIIGVNTPKMDENTPQFAANDPLAHKKEMIIEKVRQAVNEVCVEKGRALDEGSENMGYRMASLAVKNIDPSNRGVIGFTGEGQFTAGVTADYQTLSIGENFGKRGGHFISENAVVAANTPKEQSLAEIAAYQTPTMAIDQTQTQSQKQSPGPSIG